MTVYKEVNPIFAALIIYHEAYYLYLKKASKVLVMYNTFLLNKLLI